MYSLNQMAKMLTRKPSTMAGVAMREKPIPQDFIAVISLELEKRPNVKRLASSIDIGKVQITTPGRLSTKIFSTEDKDAP